jgi:hypothetical protein
VWSGGSTTSIDGGSIGPERAAVARPGHQRPQRLGERVLVGAGAEVLAAQHLGRDGVRGRDVRDPSAQQRSGSPDLVVDLVRVLAQRRLEHGAGVQVAAPLRPAQHDAHQPVLQGPPHQRPCVHPRLLDSCAR